MNISKYLKKNIIEKTKGISLVPLFLFTIIIFFISCTGTRYLKEKELLNDDYLVITSIPIRIQEEKKSCGINSLYMVLNYWNSNINYESVKSKFKKNLKSGISTVEMLLVAMNFNYSAEIKKLTYSELINLINANVPIVLLLENEYFLSDSYIMNIVPDQPKIYHYVVAIGYSDDQQEILLLTGNKEIEVFKKEYLIKKWKETNYTSIIIKPSS